MLKTIVIILILKLIRSPPLIFCSSFCQQTSCTEFGPSDCTNCNTGTWGWALSGSTCALTVVSNKQIIDTSDDVGGNIAVTNTPVSNDCSALPVNSYGSFTASMPVNVYLAGGSTLPRGHWGLDLIYEVIQVDVYGSPTWDTISKIQTSLDLAAPPQNPSIILDTNKPAVTQMIYCGNPGKRDKFYQIRLSFTHNQSGTDISFTIKSNNSNGGSKWVFKEFILVAKLCNLMCLTCFGSLPTQCTSCDAAEFFMLSNLTCAATCLSGFGYTNDPSTCVWCNLKCSNSACFGMFDNCTSCQSSGTWASFLYANSSAGYLTCESTCPTGQFGNSTARTCDLCHPICTQCSINATHCQKCITGSGWYNHECSQPCKQGLYLSNNSINCTKCNSTCSACINQSFCTICTVNGTNKAFLLNNICQKTCPSTHYSSNNNGAGPNLCLSCNPSCSACTGNPNPCQSCFSGYYLYNGSCGTTCPSLYIAYASWNKCVECQVYCVGLTINMYFPVADNYQMYIDMIFTDSLDFTTFDCLGFQSISIENQQISSFTITNLTLSASSYRIIIQPLAFIFLYNNTVTVTTIAQPSVLHTAINSFPFKTTNYGQSATINWFLIKSPGTTDLQRNIINIFSTISDTLARLTTHPLLVYAKKAGVLAMVASGAQMTSLSVLVNSVPPQNMYEAVRIWGIFVFYDVPRWQQKSGIPNHVLGPDTYDLVKNERRLFDLTTLPWRFQRIGQSSFFIYDVYVPMILIVTCWVLFLAAYLVRSDIRIKYLQGKFFSIMHKIHELATLYVTIAMMLQWMYFDGASFKRWISLAVCVLFNIYFVAYHLYIYYDMINYPLAVIGNDRYEYYLTRYSNFLKNLRFEQYKPKQEWSFRHWLRPHNYHLLSYYKKFCMIIAMPLFYQIKHVQAAILVILQAFQIIRYIGTRPYYSCWRFYLRLWLQISILLFFIVVLVSTFLIDGIAANNADTLYVVKIFNAMGWLGFCLVFFFNCGFLLLMILDIAQGFKFTNRQLLDEARRIYYYDKLLEQQRQMENIPLGQMNRLVKVGNLNMRNNQKLPNISVRIQLYHIVPKQGYYQVGVLKTVDLFMNIDLNYNSQNNTTVGSCIKKKLILTTDVSPHMLKTISGLFRQYRRMNIQAITIKTFVKIRQRNFRAGDKIPLIKQHMTQRIELQKTNGQKSTINLKSMLAGFPVDSNLLEKL